MGGEVLTTLLPTSRRTNRAVLLRPVPLSTEQQTKCQEKLGIHNDKKMTLLSESEASQWRGDSFPLSLPKHLAPKKPGGFGPMCLW